MHSEALKITQLYLSLKEQRRPTPMPEEFLEHSRPKIHCFYGLASKSYCYSFILPSGRVRSDLPIPTHTPHMNSRQALSPTHTIVPSRYSPFDKQSLPGRRSLVPAFP